MMDKVKRELPEEIFSGHWQGGHCQGIAIDTQRKYIYYSFTTMLVKTDLHGQLVGTVTGLLGHLGCIDFCDRDGRLYGYLEYKNDAVGQGILRHMGSDMHLEDAFYIAVFDVDRINRPGMDASADGVMTTVYLKEVVDDYKAIVECEGRTVAHRHGCSGIDGLTFGPIPGETSAKNYLFVAYGIYGDITRVDNDYQVLLCFDTENWSRFERPLQEGSMHHDGPQSADRKFFIYTGNTKYGVQNLEYNEFSEHYLMAVYRGKKPQFPNYPMYVIDGKKAPTWETLRGVEPETRAETLALLRPNAADNRCDVCGWDYAYGSTGICSLHDGTFYISHDGRDEKGWYTYVRRVHA